MRGTLPLVALVLPVLACTEDGPPNTNEPVRDDAGVEVRDNAFAPDEVNIPAGAHVTWVWNSSGQHGVQFLGSPTAAVPPRADGLYDRAFDTPGVYFYYCPVHGSSSGLGVSGMSGKVTVY